MTNLRRITAGVLALALGFVPASARACGHCIEDRMAAVYDHAVAEQAAHDGHEVIFTALAGAWAGSNPAIAEAVREALAHQPGVDPGSVRVSLDPPAASFALDPLRYTPTRLLAGANELLAPHRVSLAPLQPAPTAAAPPAPARRASRPDPALALLMRAPWMLGTLRALGIT